MGFLIQKGSGYLVVADEFARTLAYPAPVDGQQVFNRRTNLVETFDSLLGLWLNADMVVAVENTGLTQGYVCSGVGGGFITSLNAQLPIVGLPSGPYRDTSMGVCVQIGAVAQTTYNFVSVAKSGNYYVRVNAAPPPYVHVQVITTGELQVAVYPPSDTFGIAIGYRGDNPNYPTQSLISINNSYG